MRDLCTDVYILTPQESERQLPEPALREHPSDSARERVPSPLGKWCAPRKTYLAERNTSFIWKAVIWKAVCGEGYSETQPCTPRHSTNLAYHFQLGCLNLGILVIVLGKQL